MLGYAVSKIIAIQFQVFASSYAEPLSAVDGFFAIAAFLGRFRWLEILLGFVEFVPSVLLLFRNPLHVHSREEESIQQGTLTVQIGVKTLTVSPGDFVCLPRGVAHPFQNTGKVDAKFLLIAVPAGLEKFFEEAFYPATDCPDAPSMSEAFMGRLLPAASKCGLEFLPPSPPQD
jgi:mannose-6-phosphate isomerase-like protein (cupin superfamily)